MLRNIFQRTKLSPNACSFLTSHLHTELQITQHKTEVLNEADSDLIPQKPEPRSVFEECKEDISHVAPQLRPSFNFAAYVNRSETLKQLVKLGVDLHKLESKKDKTVPQFILGLDFDKDVAKHLLFLRDLGVSEETLGEFLTKNPMILKEDLETLQVRVNYLKSKRFTDFMITRIVAKNPYWLSFNTKNIDERLGYFQQEFGLKGYEVRTLAAKGPNLITYDLIKVKLNTFAIREEMGFTSEEVKQMLLEKPKLFMKCTICLSPLAWDFQIYLA